MTQEWVWKKSKIMSLFKIVLGPINTKHNLPEYVAMKNGGKRARKHQFKLQVSTY